MSGSAVERLDPETALEKLAGLTTTSESPDGIVRLTMTGSRIGVRLHPMRLYGVGDQTLGKDVADAFQRLLLDHNRAEGEILAAAPPQPDSPAREAFRGRVREGIRELDVRVSSRERQVRARWLGDVGLQMKFADARSCARPQLEAEIGSALERICVAYGEAVQELRHRLHHETSIRERH